MRHLAVLSILAVSFTVLVLAGPASAAPITQVKYTVTGGSFGGPLAGALATGPVLGGSVTVTLPSGVSTPPTWSCFNSSGGCGNAAVVLTGPSGYIKASGLPVAWGFLTPGFASFSHQTGTGMIASMLSGVLPPGLAATVSVWNIFANAGAGSGHFNGTFVPGPNPYSWVGTPVHTFTVGNEVRVIPEPSTVSLFALSLGFLGLTGAGRRLATRRWRPRRR
jgi:hypothetical protein